MAYEIIDNTLVWLTSTEEGFDISGQLFVMENGTIICHGVSSSEIYIAKDIYDGMSYLADVIMTS